MSNKRRKKLEDGLKVWETDLTNAEQKYQKFKALIQPKLNEIEHEIHNMKKYGDMETRGAVLDKLRKDYNNLVQKLRFYQKTLEKSNSEQ